LNRNRIIATAAITAAAAAAALIPAGSASASTTTVKCNPVVWLESQACAVLATDGWYVHTAKGSVGMNSGSAFTGRVTIYISPTSVSPGLWAGTPTFSLPAYSGMTFRSVTMAPNRDIAGNGTVTVTLFRGTGAGTVVQKWSGPVSDFTRPAQQTH
jgi:hypothetical protein